MGCTPLGGSALLHTGCRREAIAGASDRQELHSRSGAGFVAVSWHPVSKSTACESAPASGRTAGRQRRSFTRRGRPCSIRWSRCRSNEQTDRASAETSAPHEVLELSSARPRASDFVFALARRERASSRGAARGRWRCTAPGWALAQRSDAMSSSIEPKSFTSSAYGLTSVGSAGANGKSGASTGARDVAAQIPWPFTTR